VYKSYNVEHQYLEGRQYADVDEIENVKDQ
jgi:hypothetical protein